MRRCLQLGKLGLGLTRPNPMVGAVIVHKNKIIGEGFTSEFGGPHAEVNAINSVHDKAILRESTLYVSLEPCSHHGKTPPCSDLIIKHNIPEVVIGCMDPNPKVFGAGIERLKRSGVTVVSGILEQECKRHHCRFMTYHNKERPYVILKWAESKDGFMAPKKKQEIGPVWISNSQSRQLVHKWRSEEQAILIGKKTALDDDPSLTTRQWSGMNPIRIVLDNDNDLPRYLNVFDDSAQTVVLENNTAKEIVHALFEMNINSVIIEGGKQTLQLFIDSGLWDEARVFIGNSNLKEGLKAPYLNAFPASKQGILDDQLIIYYND